MRKPPPGHTDNIQMDRWSARCVENELTGCTQKVVINAFYSGWQPVKSEVPQGLALVMNPVHLHSDLDDGIETTFAKFSDDTKLDGEVDT